MSKGSKIGIIATAGIIAVLLIAMVVLEGVKSNTYVFVNNTDKDISYLAVYFTDDEYETYDEMYVGEVKKGDSVKGSYETMDCTVYDRFCQIDVEFDNDESTELIIDDGYFEGRYKGKVELEFYQEDGEYRLRTHSAPSIFDSGDNVGMNSVIYMNIDEKVWEYIE